MKLLFPALETRFKGDRELVVAARKLYQGFAGPRAKGVLPYVEVHRQLGDQLDTFEKDVDVYNLRFNLYGDRQHPEKMEDMLEHFRRVFKHAALPGVGFTLVGIRQSGGPVGPFLRDGTYVAYVDYEVVTQRTVNLPLIRGV